MRQRTFAIVMMLISFSIAKLYAQTDWVLDNSNSYISTSVIDSITFTKEENSYIQNLWHKGNIIEKGKIEEGYSYEPKEVQLKYEYCTFDEDGMDGILTENGLYAVIMYTPDSTGYILNSGIIGSDLNSSVLFDSLGYVKAIKTCDEKIYNVIYCPNELWLINSEGNVVAEIPYREFSDESNINEARMNGVRKASDFTRSGLYNAISIGNKIRSYARDFTMSYGMDLLNYMSNGIAQRYGDLISRLIALGYDLTDIIGWIEAMDKAEEISFFGNASITALDAIKQNICSFITPCKVEGLTYNTDIFRNMKGRYEELVDFTYILQMSTQTASFPHKEKQSKSINISNNGTYNDFNFDFKELQTLYDYEPSLKLDITFKTHVDEAELKRALYNVPHPPVDFKPSEYVYHRACTIYGTPNSLVTGSVSSSVEKVNNVKTTSADIICSFSQVPSGANCVVNISREGSDTGLTFSGTPGKSSQTIKATGLSVNTSYVATTYITYNGKKYDGVNSVSFTTKGPSGTVISVDNVTDKSAVAKCQFSGVESGVECGVICKSSNQSLTFPASGKEGEQSVTMSGLTPATSYQCYAYVRTSNHYQEQENGVSFTTNPPDISGTWNCTEYLSDGSVYETFTVTLNSDGSAEATENYGMFSGTSHGSWSIGSGGHVGVSLIYYSYDTQWAGKSLSGVVDNLNAPSTIEGTSYWYRGHVMGGSAEYTNKLVMTR